MVQESSAAFGTEWMLRSAEEKLLPSLTAEKGIPLLGFHSEKQLYQGCILVAHNDLGSFIVFS